MVHDHAKPLGWDCCCCRRLYNAKSMGCPAAGSLSLQIATWNVTIQRLVYSLSDCTGRKDRRQWSPHSAMTVDVFSMRMRMMKWCWWRRGCSIDSHYCSTCIDYGSTLNYYCCFRTGKRLPNRDCRFDTRTRSDAVVPTRSAV